PFSEDIKVQQAQREQMAIMSFLAGLPSEFDTDKSQILSSTEITYLQEVFRRVLRTENASSIQQTTAFIARGRNDERKKGENPTRTNEIICYYCKEPGHTKRTCRLLQKRIKELKLSLLMLLLHLKEYLRKLLLSQLMSMLSIRLS